MHDTLPDPEAAVDLLLKILLQETDAVNHRNVVRLVLGWTRVCEDVGQLLAEMLVYT